MIQKRSVLGAAAFFILSALTVGWLALAADIGGKDNPLVTLDYLKSLNPQIETTIEDAVREKLDAQMVDIRAYIDSARDELGSLPSGGSPGGVDVNALLNDADFINEIAKKISGQVGEGTEISPYAVSVRVDVKTGEVLRLPMGSSVMLRLGSGTVVAGSPGLINLTTGGTLDAGGSLAVNNLYTVTIADGREIKCTSNMTVFVWGPYF